MTETPTQTLRRAAEKLRGLANSATDGPWRYHDTHLGRQGGHTATVLADRSDGSGLIAWLPTWNEQHWDESRNVWNDSRFIAAMHPGVAVPLADWLDTEAAVHEAGMQASEALCVVVEAAGAGEHRVQVHASTLDQALAVARSILGGEATQ